MGNPMKARIPQPSHLQQHPRCLARRRKSQALCQAPAMPNGRCRIHGGLSTGAPKGKRNGMWRHGRYSQESIEVRRAIKALLRDAQATLTTFDDI